MTILTIFRLVHVHLACFGLSNAIVLYIKGDLLNPDQGQMKRQCKYIQLFLCFALGFRESGGIRSVANLWSVADDCILNWTISAFVGFAILTWNYVTWNQMLKYWLILKWDKALILLKQNVHQHTLKPSVVVSVEKLSMCSHNANMWVNRLTWLSDVNLALESDYQQWWSNWMELTQ